MASEIFGKTQRLRVKLGNRITHHVKAAFGVNLMKIRQSIDTSHLL